MLHDGSWYSVPWLGVFGACKDHGRSSVVAAEATATGWGSSKLLRTPSTSIIQDLQVVQLVPLNAANSSQPSTNARRNGKHA